AMQGPWTVSIKFKEPGRQQRFTIGGGATTGFGHHTTGPVPVAGANWTISIEASDDGVTWTPSAIRIKTPTATSGVISVDIESTDAADYASSQDFDDLILTCSTADTGLDFVVYGHATAYSGNCWNPCYTRFLVIDSDQALKRALANTVLRRAVQAIYPERL